MEAFERSLPPSWKNQHTNLRLPNSSRTDVIIRKTRQNSREVLSRLWVRLSRLETAFYWKMAQILQDFERFPNPYSVSLRSLFWWFAYDDMNNVFSGNILIWHVMEKASWDRGSSSISEPHDFCRRVSQVDWVLVSLGFPRYRALPGNRRKIGNSQVLFSWFSGYNKRKRFEAKFFLKISLRRWESTSRGFLKLIQSSYAPFVLAFWRILLNHLVAMFSVLHAFQDGWTQIILVQTAERKYGPETWSLLCHSLKTSSASSKFVAISFNMVALKQWSWNDLGLTPTFARLLLWPARTRDVK